MGHLAHTPRWILDYISTKAKDNSIYFLECSLVPSTCWAIFLELLVFQIAIGFCLCRNISQVRSGTMESFPFAAHWQKSERNVSPHFGFDWKIGQQTKNKLRSLTRPIPKRALPKSGFQFLFRFLDQHPRVNKWVAGERSWTENM